MSRRGEGAEKRENGSLTVLNRKEKKSRLRKRGEKVSRGGNWHERGLRCIITIVVVVVFMPGKKKSHACPRATKPSFARYSSSQCPRFGFLLIINALPGLPARYPASAFPESPISNSFPRFSFFPTLLSPMMHASSILQNAIPQNAEKEGRKDNLDVQSRIIVEKRILMLNVVVFCFFVSMLKARNRQELRFTQRRKRKKHI